MYAKCPLKMVNNIGLIFNDESVGVIKNKIGWNWKRLKMRVLLFLPFYYRFLAVVVHFYG